MVGISGGGGSGGGGYNYVQDAQPVDPTEGEEWYDTGSNAAFVYDGAAWIEQTVVDHGQLSGVGASDHHAPYTDADATAASPPAPVPTSSNSVKYRNTEQSDSGSSNNGSSGTDIWMDLSGYAFIEVRGEISVGDNGGYNSWASVNVDGNGASIFSSEFLGSNSSHASTARVDVSDSGYTAVSFSFSYDNGAHDWAAEVRRNMTMADL